MIQPLRSRAIPLIDKSILTLLVVSHDTLGNSLTDGVDLGSGTTSIGSNSNINVFEFVIAEDEDGLVHLQLKSLGGDEAQGGAIDLDQTGSLLDKGNGGCGFLYRTTV